MEKIFHVVFTGKLHAGFKHADAVEKMAAMFQLDRHKVAKLLFSGRPTIMKQELSWEQALKYHDHLEQIGLRMQIIEAEARPPRPPQTVSQTRTPAPPSPKGPEPAAHATDTPAPDTTAIDKAAPAAPVDTPATTAAPAEQDTPTVAEPSATSIPFKKENAHGWLWIKEAFGLFFRQPLKWTVIMILFFATLLLPVLLIPFAGGLLSALLTPIFHGGMMLGAQRQKEGRQLRIAHLFHGFNHNLFQLLVVGLFNILVLIDLGAILFLGYGNIMSLGKNQPATEAFTTLIQNLPHYQAGLLVCAILSIPLIMGCWFAPCLVVLGKRSALDGFRLSFKAIRINIVAFLIYVLVFLFLGLLFMFLYGALAALFSFLLGSDNYFLFLLLPMLFMIIMGIPFTTVVPLSMYSGYRDIFTNGEATADQ